MAETRMRSICPSCRHYGRGCSGYPVAEEGPKYISMAHGNEIACIKDRGILDYIEKRLCEVGVIDPISGQVRLPGNYKPVFRGDLNATRVAHVG
jgi:uncharacterized protein